MLKDSTLYVICTQYKCISHLIRRNIYYDKIHVHFVHALNECSHCLLMFWSTLNFFQVQFRDVELQRLAKQPT